MPEFPYIWLRILPYYKITTLHLLVLMFDSTDHISIGSGPIVIHFFGEFASELFGILQVVLLIQLQTATLQCQLLLEIVYKGFQVQIFLNDLFGLLRQTASKLQSCFSRELTHILESIERSLFEHAIGSIIVSLQPLISSSLIAEGRLGILLSTK